MQKDRVWEIDLFRVTAITLMIVFHFVYDLDTFTTTNISFQSPFWFWVGKISALLFIFISGISSGFSRHPLKRGLRVFLYGLLITLVTYIAMPDQFVRFGILHFLGISMLIYPLFRRANPFLIILLSMASFVLGYFLHGQISSHSFLLPFGVIPVNFSTIDYYPLFPYLGFFLLGLLAFKTFYAKGHRLIPINYHNRYLFFLSHHSLAIYLLHQPLLLSLIYLSKFGSKL